MTQDNGSTETAIENIFSFLTDFKLVKTAEMLRRESKLVHKYTVQKERYNDLLKTIMKANDQNQAVESTEKPKKDTHNNTQKKKDIKPMSGKFFFIKKT